MRNFRFPLFIETKPAIIIFNQQQKATKRFGESHFNHVAFANKFFYNYWFDFQLLGVLGSK